MEQRVDITIDNLSGKSFLLIFGLDVPSNSLNVSSEIPSQLSAITSWIQSDHSIVPQTTTSSVKLMSWGMGYYRGNCVANL